MRKRLADVFLGAMLVILGYGFFKTVAGDIGDNIERQVDGLMYMVCSLAGVAAYVLVRNMTLGAKVRNLEKTGLN